MATYADTFDVARILRSSANHKIRFSDRALVEVSAFTDSTHRYSETAITVSPDNVVISDSYDGQLLLKFVFSSATDYSVYEADTKLKRDLLLGTGTISTNFTTPDNLITVPSTVFSGTITTGNEVEFKMDAHMSLCDADLYIEEAEIEVDLMLSSMSVDFLTDNEVRLFTSVTTPPAIKVATQYLAAYYIYTDVFRGKFVDDDAVKDSYCQRWKRKAERFMKKYAEVENISAPAILSFPSFVDQFGLSSAGPGPAGLSSDPDEITRPSGSAAIFETSDGE